MSTTVQDKLRHILSEYELSPDPNMVGVNSIQAMIAPLLPKAVVGRSRHDAALVDRSNIEHRLVRVTAAAVELATSLLPFDETLELRRHHLLQGALHDIVAAILGRAGSDWAMTMPALQIDLPVVGTAMAGTTTWSTLVAVLWVPDTSQPLSSALPHRWWRREASADAAAHAPAAGEAPAAEDGAADGRIGPGEFHFTHASLGSNGLDVGGYLAVDRGGTGKSGANPLPGADPWRRVAPLPPLPDTHDPSA